MLISPGGGESEQKRAGCQQKDGHIVKGGIDKLQSVSKEIDEGASLRPKHALRRLQGLIDRL